MAGASRKPFVLDLIGLAARLILGGVVLVAGLLKVTDPTAAERAVRAYQILPYDLAGTVGLVLPIVEIVAGVLLILGLFTRIAAVIGGLLMIAFIIGIASAWARGLTIECGCFGGGGTIPAAETNYLPEILRDIGLVICAGWLTVRPRTTFSLDRRLF
jgi:uncharacterized membrane protein YphA (DoxX/SURF4 family)